MLERFRNAMAHEFKRGNVTKESIENKVKCQLLGLAGHMVNDAAALKADVTVTDGGVVMVELSSAKQDRAYLIGRGGRNADAMRQIFMSICAKYGYKFFLNIVE